MPRIKALCNVVIPAGAPAFTPAPGWQSGPWASIADAGPGDTSPTLSPAEGGDVTQTVLVATMCNGVALAGSDLPTLGIIQANDVAKNITTCQEAALGGASTAVDLSYGLALIDLLDDREEDELRVVGAGVLQGAPGALAWLWQDGSFAAPTNVGVGLYTVNLNPQDAVDSQECVVLLSAIRDIAASAMSGFNVIHTSDVAKDISCVREQAAGAASILADEAFYVVILGRGGAPSRRSPRTRLKCACHVTAGVGPTFSAQSGHFAAIARTGAGDYNVDLSPEYAMDSLQSAWIVICGAQIFPSGNTSFGVTPTTDTRIRITSCVEQAGGAASIRADVNFCLLGFEYVG